MTKREKALQSVLQDNEAKLQSKAFLEMQKSVQHFKKMVESGVAKSRGYNIMSIGEKSRTIAFNVKN